MATRDESTVRRATARSDERVSLGHDAASERSHRPIRMLIITLVLVAALLVAALVGFIVLSSTPAFTIASIDAEATEHLSAENIAKLANVEEGTTLLSFDETLITENLKRNPWVGTVAFEREFPDRLKIIVTERRTDCVVKMSSGSVCWCLGDDNVWIEPINLSVKDGQSANDVALALAQDMGALLVTDVPTSMSPSAGSAANDEVLKAIAAYREQFSDDFASQIVCFSASSVESIACTLKSGVEISLGAPSNIDIKESVIQQILTKHPNQVTYINVRVPSQPSYRKLGVESVSEGSGVSVDLNKQDIIANPAPPTTDETTEDGTQGESEEYYDEYYDESWGYDESYDESWGYDETYDESYDYSGEYYDETYDESYGY